MIPFDAANWYWIVGADTTRVYSSYHDDDLGIVAGYVPTRDARYQDWLTKGGTTTKIALEQDLFDYLIGRVLDGTPPTATSTDAAKDQRIAEQLSEVIYQIAFSHENRIRALEGVTPPLTRDQFYTRVKGLMK